MTLFAVIAAMSMVFAGCKKKKGEEDKGTGGMEAMSEAMDAMEMDAPMDAMEMDAPMDAMEMDAPMGEMGGGDEGGDTLGIKECDEYIKIYKCYLGKLPAAAKGPAEAAYKKMVGAWKKGIDAAMGSEASKKAIAKGCKTAVESFKKAMKNNPTAKDCIK
jgi:hypothetical protein